MPTVPIPVDLPAKACDVALGPSVEDVSLCPESRAAIERAPSLGRALDSASAVLVTWYVVSRARRSRWQLAIATTAGLLMGLNILVIWYGPIGHTCRPSLFLSVATFLLDPSSRCCGRWRTPPRQVVFDVVGVGRAEMSLEERGLSYRAITARRLVPHRAAHRYAETAGAFREPYTT